MSKNNNNRSKKKINRQFYTMKFKSSRLRRFNYNISLSFDEAKELKEIIALADSQILRSIRDIRKRDVNYSLLEELYDKREKLKKMDKSSDNSAKIKEIQEKINKMMYIPEYVTVVMEHPKHYEYIYHNGIIINGKKYKRFSCSSSQARVSTVVLCDESIIPELRKRLDNGRDLNKPLAPSKFNAYFGLAGSATQIVSEPKFIVVKDFTNQTTFKANFVTETDWNEDDIVEVRDVTLDMTRNDGMGLISPAQSKKWAEELGLDWVPSQWCIRQNYIKGMLCTFDMHDFCEKINGGSYLVDTIYTDDNGNTIKADLRDYDVIITESQFKLWDSFKSVDEYIENCRTNKLYWGISQYTPRQPKDILNLNYQFLQTLNLSMGDVEELCSQFVEWICGVSYDNFAYMILFLLGVNITEEGMCEFLKNSESYWIKCLIANPEIRNDRYIRMKIHDLIKYKIQNGCLGSIIVDGNFQVLVSDPYALMQHVCGLEVTGLLYDGEFYSGYWNRKNVNRVDAMRSPLTYRSEHVILDLAQNSDTEYWYKYCQDGIILNYYGHETVRFAGSDFDYDQAATTSNSVMLRSTYKDELPVVYNPPKPHKIVCTEDDLYHADTFSFGSIIGQITNKGSNGYAMLPLIEKEYGKDSDEYKLTMSRLQQCCKAQSAQIDKAKIGKEVKGIPDVWIRWNEINESDSDDAKNKKQFYNRILLNKYPYFFKYLYRDAKKKYNKYVDQCETTCHQKFKMSIAKLEALNRKTPEQKTFLKNYYAYMPLTFSDSAMNLVCRYIEQVNFNIKDKVKISDGNWSSLLYQNLSYKWDEETCFAVKEVIRKHRSSVSTSMNVNDVSERMFEDDIYEFVIDNNNLFFKINQVCSNVYEAINYLVDYFYNDVPSSNKDILWNTYGDYIFDNVKLNTGNGDSVVVPLPDENGDIKYLGKNYSLKEVLCYTE